MTARVWNTLDDANPWIVATAEAKRQVFAPVAIFAAIVALALGLYLGPAAGTAVLSALQGTQGLPLAAVRAVRYACVFAPLYVFPGLSLRFFERRRMPFGVGWLGFGLLVGGASFLLALATAFVLRAGIVEAVSAVTPELVGGVSAIAGLAAFQSLAEEFFFRGWLQPLVARQWGVWPGLIATSLLFVAAHLVRGAIHEPVAVLNVFLAGATFGLLALRTGSLAAPFAAHWTWNWLERGVFGMTPNPGVDRLGSLVDIDLVGPRFLSGGADELNGTIEAMLALGLAVLVLAVWSAPPRLQATAGTG
jgi:membrane protease YdiL (CAAX protease family)